MNNQTIYDAIIDSAKNYCSIEIRKEENERVVEYIEEEQFWLDAFEVKVRIDSDLVISFFRCCQGDFYCDINGTDINIYDYENTELRNILYNYRKQQVTCFNYIVDIQKRLNIRPKKYKDPTTYRRKTGVMELLNK